MARGWESKSVEEQLSSAEEEKGRRAKPVLSESELQQQAKRKSLLLTRARVERELEGARSVRHRQLLKRTLAHIEAELAKLDSSSS